MQDTKPPRGKAVRRPFSSLAKPTGAACNLDCTYCFFLSKELLYDHESQMMSRDNLELYLRNFLDSQPAGEVAVEWQGGEPTMRGLGFFREAVDLARKWARPGQRVRHSLQTNGTLLDEEWADFLASENFLVGLSIDGPREMHDEYRVNRGRRGSYDQVIRGWNLLQQHHIDTNILCTVHAANQEHPLEVYRHFRDDLGARFLQFIPIVERIGSPHQTYYRQEGDHVSERSVSPDKWGRFLSTVFDEWRTRDVGEVFVQHFDAMVGNAVGLYTTCIHAPECGESLAVLPNGQIYACDHWVEEGYERGNIADVAMRDVLIDEAQVQFGRDKRGQLPSECLECDVRWACHGGCPKDRFLGEGERKSNYLCAGYKSFFRHATPTVAQIVTLGQQGLPASLIMGNPTEATPSPGSVAQLPWPQMPTSG